MSEYVSLVELEINGTSITDFKAVSEGAYSLNAPVNLMGKTGHIAKTSRYSVSVDYVVPFSTDEFDFSQVRGGRLTIDHLNGRRITYTGVYTEEVGEAKADGDNEMVKTIKFSCEDRLKE